MRAGGCPAVVAQWQSTGGSSQRCPGFDSRRLPAFFTFLYFRLITSKFIYLDGALKPGSRHCCSTLPCDCPLPIFIVGCSSLYIYTCGTCFALHEVLYSISCHFRPCTIKSDSKNSESLGDLRLWYLLVMM